ncbi:MAG: RluA family pseudouridine synthase [Chitinophagales bacterium]
MEILFEDADLLIINKPSGLQVERDKWGYASVEENAEKYLLEKQKKIYVGIVHRIDRPVSGVLLLAKKKSVLLKLNDQFREKQVKKTYYGIVSGKPGNKTGKLFHWIKRDAENKLALVSTKKSTGAFYCELNYEIVSEKENKILLRLTPVTGKFHQIRAQLSYIGCPIVGDKQYKSTETYKENAICLHAYSLEFLHPVTKELMKIECEMPGDKAWGLFHVEKKK